MAEISKISYAPDATKALEAILWVVQRKPGIDIYKVCKCLYFADLTHLSTYGRTIFGERYIADTYGPRGSSAYGIMRHRMDEMLALQGADVPVTVTPGPHYTVIAGRAPDLDRLSESDVDALEEAIAKNGEKSFNELYRETHDHMAYIEADGGTMDYRDMISMMRSDVPEEVLKEMLDDISSNIGTIVY